ncbi:MAG TPA: hypothetical protein VK687_08785 [Bryobacteraceae bacterium]|jgi:hypothetical protein|nr:hypothetical protein [Bryobacteraceae bacterium]
MRLIVAVLVVASSAFAQGRLNPIGNSGNVLHPGIPAAGAPGTGRTGFAPRPLSGGFQRGDGGQRGGGFGRAGRTVIVPYPLTADPFYGGFSNGPGYGSTRFFQPPPGSYDPIWGIYNPGPGDSEGQSQQPQSPTVVINQNFQPDTIRPVLRDYSNVQLPEPTFKQVVPAPQTGAAAGNDQPTIYLIAMKDHTIVPVLGYWMDKGALNYVTVESVIGHVPLDQVDREFSQRLNDERHIEFQLPSGK